MAMTKASCAKSRMRWGADVPTIDKYWAVTVSGADGALEPIFAWFYRHGVSGVQWEDGEPAWQAFTDIPMAPGTPFVTAYFADTPQWPAKRLRLVEEARAQGWELQLKEVQSRDWEQAWKQYYRPIPLSNGYGIVPAWYTESPWRPERTIWLDPGMAFGTGDHPSTKMCLDWMVREKLGGRRVLDLGAGSGILAILAAKLGANPVVAVEPDPVALKSLGANLALNRVTHRVEVLAGTLESVPGNYHFDWVVGNLITDLIVPLWPQIAERLPLPGGGALLAGIVEDRVPEVEAAVATTPSFQVTDYWFEAGWATLLVRHQ